MERTIIINSYSLRSIQKDIDKLNKKCDKLGVTRPIITIGEVYEKSVDTGEVDWDSFPYTKVRKFSVCNVTIQYEPIKLADWQAIAIIRHGEGQWLQFDIQADYDYNFIAALKDCSCEHCGNKRLSKSFVLRKGNEYKKVGSTCLKEFTGVNPESYFTLFKTISVTFGSDEDFEPGKGNYQPRNYVVYEVDDVLNASAKVLSVDGKYIKNLYHEQDRYSREQPKRSNAGESTSDKVRELLTVRSNKLYMAANPEYKPSTWQLERIERCEKSEYFAADTFSGQFAEDARKWLEMLQVRVEIRHDDEYGDSEIANEYDQKLKQFATQRRIMDNELGFVCYIAEAYKQTICKAEQITGHFCVNGQRVELKLKEVASTGFDGAYGYTYIKTYIDPSNRVFKYMGSSPSGDINKDEFTSVLATVKHDNYRGVAETKLQRIKSNKTL